MADAFRLSCSNASRRAVLPYHGLIRRASPPSDYCACAPGFAVAPLSLDTRRNLASFKVHAAVAETNQPKWWERNVGPNMIDIHSTQEFLSALSQAGDRLVIVEFYGTWCASCRALFPKKIGILRSLGSLGHNLPVSRNRGMLCKIAEQHPEILFLKVNFDENKPMCKSLKVKVLPCFHFYRGSDGQIEAFSCSLAKFKKIKDAISAHNVAPYNNKSTSNHRVLTLESLVKDQS